MPDKSSNVPSSLVYTAIGAESLRIARASNNPESFSTAIKPLIGRMSRQGVSTGSFILNFLNKYRADFDVSQSKQKLLNLISWVVNTYFLNSFRPTNNIGCYCYADKTIIPVYFKYMKNKINKNQKINNNKINE